MRAHHWAGTVMLMIGALAAGCGGSGRHDVTVLFKDQPVQMANDLNALNALAHGRTPNVHPCDYSDIDPSTEVKLTDERGTLLGAGRFGTGKNDLPAGHAGEYLTCDYRVTFQDVPTNRSQYVITDDAQSDDNVVSKAKMDKWHWGVVIVLSHGT